MTLRDARPEDAPVLARCIMAGMHFYDFETPEPEDTDIYRRLIACERRDDLLYSYRYTRVAEDEGTPVGSLLSYPGDIYRSLRQKTFSEIWPELSAMDQSSEQETGPGEYYLDSLAVLPDFRKQGIGRALILDGVRKALSLGFRQVALVVDPDYPHLVRLYESLGFVPAGRRNAFGTDFLRMIYCSHS